MTLTDTGRKRLLDPDDQVGPTVHNLKAQPAPANVKPTPGEAVIVDDIGKRSFFQRKRRDVTALRLIKQGMDDDIELARRVKEAQRAAYPSSGAEGSRRSGTSDPTAAAAIRPRIPDPAEMYYVERDLALRHLARADSYRRRALSMSQASGTILKIALEELAEEQIEGDVGFCPDCAKAGVRNERGQAKDVGADSPYCRDCHCFRRDHGIPRPRWLIRKKETTGRTTSRDVELALRSAQPQNPGQ